MQGPLKVLSGRAHPDLTVEIGSYLNIEPARITIRDFSDGETHCQIDENVRGGDVFVVQPTSPPANNHIMELLIILDAVRRSSANRITAVLPYFGYARQDRKDRPRVPITAKLVANLLVSAGADRILCIDLHAYQIQGFFDIPVDHLLAIPVLLEELGKRNFSDLTVVSPDAGGVERARAIASRIHAQLAIVDKRRTGPNQSSVMNVIGDVRGRTTLIVDDIIDTAGTLVKTAEALLENGAREVYAACTHPVFSGPALERLNGSVIKEIIATNTMPTDDKVAGCSKIKVLSIGPLLGEAIKRIHEDDSVSSLFV